MHSDFILRRPLIIHWKLSLSLRKCQLTLWRRHVFSKLIVFCIVCLVPSWSRKSLQRNHWASRLTVNVWAVVSCGQYFSTESLRQSFAKGFMLSLESGVHELGICCLGFCCEAVGVVGQQKRVEVFGRWAVLVQYFLVYFDVTMLVFSFRSAGLNGLVRFFDDALNSHRHGGWLGFFPHVADLIATSFC